jgi:hypothetical protein
VFGSDVPGTRAREPFEIGHVKLIESAVGAEVAAMVLNENGRDLYHIDGECDARVCAWVLLVVL